MVSPKRNKFKRSSKACTACRQMKLKCDAVDRFPKPCNRCAKYGSVCQIDLSFERERRRSAKKLGSVADPLAESMETAESSSSVDILKADINASETMASAVWATDFRELTLGPAVVIEDQVLENNIIIPGETIRLIFNNFYKWYYPNIPILTRDLLNPLYLLGSKDSDFKVLFWAICAVSSPSCCDDATADSIGKHAKNQIINSRDALFTSTPLCSLARVLALLILCAFPLYHTSLQEDPSSAYCSRAIDIAMRIGLHRSSFTQEYNLRTDALKEQVTLARFCWAGCFVTNQGLATFSGLPSLISLNHGMFPKMFTSVEGNSYLTEYIKQAKILLALKQAVEILGNNPDTEFGMTDPGSRKLLHRSVEQSFSQLIADMAPLSEMTELYCLCAKLQFHSFLLVPDTELEDQQAMVIPIYLVCIKILDIVQALSKDQTNFKTWPGFVIRLQVFSAVILFGLIISPFGSLINVDEARNKIAEVYSLLSKAATRENDSATRGMRLLDGLQYMHNNKLIPPMIFTVRSRLGASAFWSLLLIFKRFQLDLHSRNRYAGDDRTKNLVNRPLSEYANEQLEPVLMADENIDPDIKSFLEGMNDWELWQPFAEAV
ncbi:Sef1p [Sugiyamaella lignohabitans]|uniref:Sef1p n=1 Tax=Sugiyamaella lignohabitans TaxID=796027 RepID=A0A167FCM2_9ASCO|nr:Sef1p [Sugiyamaella lignohabitans]ANB15123.1 Sef1p [Sugiyamaella lignohabitans]